MRKWTKEKVINRIKYLEQIKTQLNSSYVQNNHKPLYMAVIKLFGNWSTALRSSGIDPNKIRLKKQWNPDKVINEIINRKKILKPLNSNALQRMDKKLFYAALKYFGNWNSALEAAGLDPSTIRKPNIVRTIEDVRLLAESKGGKCLSKKYVNARTCMKWECEEGHRWKTRFFNIQQGCWCPYCGLYLNENKCRFIFEFFTGSKFPKTRKILKNKKELDGYCKELNFAFEYQGQQHFYYVKYFHKTKENFLKKKKIDLLKIKECKELNINLLLIPYTIFNKNDEEISYIYKEIKKNGIRIIKDLKSFSYDGFSNSRLTKIREFIKNKGGKLISKCYLGSDKKLKIKCENGHTCFLSWDYLKQGSWCKMC